MDGTLSTPRGLPEAGKKRRATDELRRENRALKGAIAALKKRVQDECDDASDGRERLALMRAVNQHLVLEKLEAVDARNAADADVQRKTVFLSILAHELRNPIASIAVANSVMAKNDDAQPRMKKMMAIVERQAIQLLRLADDLLDASHIASGRISLRIGSIALADMVEAALDTAQPFLARRSQAIDVTLPPFPVRLDGDMVRLSQLLSNLIVNASKFSAPGRSIFLSARVAHGVLAIAVRDEGKGIAHKDRARIFDLFTQGSDAMEHTLSGGLGIGLSLVRAVAEMHGGSVCVKSEGVGCGSEFTVQLPLPVIITHSPDTGP